ncbi:hypothetical protein [Deinococcus sp. JMULE3]|uniref:hypothetical protein n=1 Tax=Deinococcus sp. JMULE3 TaxID=2518341 RepID=UPI001575A17B|nr:hypothetical protein [Deinococcus sp. JMULE3]NTY00674.1 hypothetical protein [Deinococcus sp. JMULE3]
MPCAGAGCEAQARAFFGVFLGLTELVKPEALRRNGGVWFGLPDGRQLHVGVAPEFVPRVLLHDRSGNRLEVVQGAHPARMVKVG